MTSDSISTRPRISANRMSPVALGLRAMASAAELRPLDWPSAPNAAAIASANPAVMIDHLATSLPPAGAAPWAKSGATMPAATKNTVSDNVSDLRTINASSENQQGRGLAPSHQLRGDQRPAA